MAETRYAEAIIKQLMDSMAALGEHATEITLPTRVFLNVAADLQSRFMEIDHRLPVRMAHDYLAAFSFARMDQQSIGKSASRQVHVGDSFVIQGPRGPVTIREARNA